MKKSTVSAGAGLLAALLLATGCHSTTRSISNSGYQEYSGNSINQRLELSEFDVLGIEPGKAVSEEEIAQASASARHVNLKEGGSILLVQSGAEYPDGPMLNALNAHFNVIPFTGVAVETRPEAPMNRSAYTTRNVAIVTDPSKPVTVVPLSRERYETKTTTPEERQKQSYSKLLRLAAARGGADTVVCYWGILESASEHLPTKTISWLPLVNWMVPDEREYMRIRVKMAVIDVRTGDWTMLSPKPFEDKSWTVSPRRAVVDQKQVEALKAKAYSAGARELVERYLKS